jgi:hypothetical protein
LREKVPKADGGALGDGNSNSNSNNNKQQAITNKPSAHNNQATIW